MVIVARLRGQPRTGLSRDANDALLVLESAGDYQLRLHIDYQPQTFEKSWAFGSIGGAGLVFGRNEHKAFAVPGRSRMCPNRQRELECRVPRFLMQPQAKHLGNGSAPVSSGAQEVIFFLLVGQEVALDFDTQSVGTEDLNELRTCVVGRRGTALAPRAAQGAVFLRRSAR